MGSLKETYLNKGYVVFENLLPMSLIEDLRAIVDSLIDNAAALTTSDEVYEILDDPNSGKPRIERIKSPHKVRPLFNELIRCPEITDVLRTLLGPDVRLHPGGSRRHRYPDQQCGVPHRGTVPRDAPRSL